MKVKELIKNLSKLDLESDVLFYSQDENLAPQGYFVRVFEVIDIDEVSGIASRDDSGVVSMQFGDDELARRYAGVELTSNI